MHRNFNSNYYLKPTAITVINLITKLTNLFLISEVQT